MDLVRQIEQTTASSWDELYIRMLYLVANKSHDHNTKVGAVITGQDHTIRSIGYNGLPRGVKHNPERMMSPEKYKWTSHAEENAILNAGRARTSIVNGIIYINFLPCNACARAIVQSGIGTVRVHEQGSAAYINSAISRGNTKWDEVWGCSIEMFHDAGVDLQMIDYKINEEIAYFNGSKCLV